MAQKLFFIHLFLQQLLYVWAQISRESLGSELTKDIPSLSSQLECFSLFCLFRRSPILNQLKIIILTTVSQQLTTFNTSSPQVVDTINGSVKPREDLAEGEFLDSLGSHYVKSITYGVEMVASLKFKSSSKYVSQLC